MGFFEKIFGKKNKSEGAPKRQTAPKRENTSVFPGGVTRQELGVAGYFIPPHPSFSLQRKFSDAQLLTLRRGFKTGATGEWSWCMEGDTLYLCRNEASRMIYYRIDLSPETNCHPVTVARQMKMNLEAEKNFLLRWFDSRVGGEQAAVNPPPKQPQKPQAAPAEPAARPQPPLSKTAQDWREEGLALEQQEKYEEAFQKYEEAAKGGDTPSMVYIARMYLSGKLRPIDSFNLAELLQGGPIFPWSVRNEKQPDYKSGLEWLKKAAEAGDALSCETLGNMLCAGIGCKADAEQGIVYLEKAVLLGRDSAKKYICLYRPDGKALTDEAYEACLADFARAAEAGDEKAYQLYATLKSGTEKQLARLGHVLIAAQNISRPGFEPFSYSFSPSGIPLIPAAAKRMSWRTFLRFNLDAWAEERPLIAVSADILDVNQPSWLLCSLHHAKIVGRAVYKSPQFGWLGEEKKAVLIRLGEPDALSAEEVAQVASSFALKPEEYQGGALSFIVEQGEKEYSLEIAGIQDGRVEVLWRYTIGGSSSVDAPFQPELISMEITVE